MDTNGPNGQFGAEQFSPAEQAALQALRELPRPVASPVARSRARLALVTGSEAKSPRDVREVEPRRRFFWMRFAAPVAVAAAAVLVALIVHGTRPAHQWFITDVKEPAGITADAETLEAGARIAAGTVTTAEGSELEIQLGDQLRFRMLPGASITLPEPPGRWFGKERTIRLADGEIYGTTGSEPLAFDLSVETEEATARIFGTTFAVLRLDVGTCVCLWLGGVEVTPATGGPVTRLREEMKFYVYNDGRPSEMVPIDDMERMKLSMTHDAGLVRELP